MQKPQTFNDGIVKIYEVTNIAEPPLRPVEGLALKDSFRYKERTVGLTRTSVAMQNGVTVAYVLRCQRKRSISTQDIAIPNDGKQYRITRIQYPEDITPPVMDIELQEVQMKYEVMGL